MKTVHLVTPGALWTAMDHAKQMEDTYLGNIPTGAMVEFPWADIPVGYLRCDGSVLSAAAFPDLAALIGSMLPNDPTKIIKY